MPYPASISERQRQLSTSLSTSTPSQSKMMRSGCIITRFPFPSEHILRKWAITQTIDRNGIKWIDPADGQNGAAVDDVFRAGNGAGARRDEKGAERRPFAEDYIPQRKAAVWTGASQRRFISSSSIDTVTEQPAISSDVTKLPTSDRVTIVPAGSSNRRTASYIK